MANASFNPHDIAVSTRRAIKAAGDRFTAGAESKAPRNAAPTPAIDPVTEARLLNSCHRAVQLIESDTGISSPSVLITVQDRAASLLQSKLATDGSRGEPFQAGGFEAKFGEGPRSGDL